MAEKVKVKNVSRFIDYLHRILNGLSSLVHFFIWRESQLFSASTPLLQFTNSSCFYLCMRKGNTCSPVILAFCVPVSWTVTFLAGSMYHAGQSVPEGLLGSTCALQEQTAVLEVVTRTAGYCVWWRTLGAPRFLGRHTGRQYHRVDNAETVPTAIPPIVTFSARRGRRLSPLSSGPWPRRPHIIIIAPLRSRLVPIRSSFLAPTLTGFHRRGHTANNAKKFN